MKNDGVHHERCRCRFRQRARLFRLRAVPTASSKRPRAGVRGMSAGSGSLSTTNAGSGRRRSSSCTATRPAPPPRPPIWCSRINIPTTINTSRPPSTTYAATVRRSAPGIGSSTPRAVSTTSSWWPTSCRTTPAQSSAPTASMSMSPRRRPPTETISAAIAEIAENRATIEQAKGMLMVVYGIDSAGGVRPAAVAFPGGQRQAAAARRTGGHRFRAPDPDPRSRRAVGLRQLAADRRPAHR